MSQEFKFTDPGEGLQEAEILEVHVSEGDTVEDGDTVLTVETDKANTDVPAPFSGTVQEVRVSEGDTVEVGDVLMTYDEGGESGGEEEDKGEESEERESKSEESAEDEEEKQKAESKEKSEESGQARDQEKEQKKETTEKSKESEEKSRSEKRSSREPVPAAPSTRRLAREKGVDLHDIEPSGEHGRVTAEDVEAAASSAEGEKESKKAKGGEREGSPLVPGYGQPPTLPDFSQWGEVERMPLRSIRRATAQNMARSWGQIPHVFHQDIADVTELERFRRAHEEGAQAQGGKFTLTVLMMKALISVLKQFPRFNSSLDVENQEIVLKHYFHIGLAVATDRGLLVPVIRDVDKKNLVELTHEATDIAQKTRDGDIKAEEMTGASMTLTNPGAMGGTSLTPLINHPQVAILGMAQARLEPVVHGDLDSYDIKPRLRLPLILGFDHRVNDGADAAQFVTALIRTLADPESLVLNI